MANAFSHALVKKPKRSRNDFTHSNKLGMRFGALTPTLTEMIFPDDDVAISMAQVIRLAPMPLPTFMDLKIRHDFFFVPLRLLYGVEHLDKVFGYGGNRGALEPNDFLKNFVAYYDDGETPIPNSSVPFVSGTLLDHLGYCPPSQLTDWQDQFFDGIDVKFNKLKTSNLSNDIKAFNNAFAQYVWSADANSTPVINTDPLCIEKIIAYHFIWRDWYRFTGINPDNTEPENYLLNGVLSILPYEMTNTLASPVDSWLNDSKLLPFLASSSKPFNSSYLTQYKYAHLRKDMFTSVRYGNKPQVLIPANGTIPQLREASAVQRFVDLLSITGKRYYDNILGIFGVRPEGPADDRVQFLARYQSYIKSGEVITTATTSEATTGDYAGRGILIDAKNYIFKRHFTEHGYLFCISSIVPEVDYRGMGRDITDISVYDIPNPPLSQIGDQSVLKREMYFDWNDALDTSIGDQFRYYAYKSHNNEVHGDFLSPTLAPFTSLPHASSSFASIPLTNVIDFSRVTPAAYNYIFNDVTSYWLNGERFFAKLDFDEWITRSLPKYINYHL